MSVAYKKLGLEPGDVIKFKPARINNPFGNFVHEGDVGRVLSAQKLPEQYTVLVLTGIAKGQKRTVERLGLNQVELLRKHDVFDVGDTVLLPAKVVEVAADNQNEMYRVQVIHCPDHQYWTNDNELNLTVHMKNSEKLALSALAMSARGVLAHDKTRGSFTVSWLEQIRKKALDLLTAKYTTKQITDKVAIRPNGAFVTIVVEGKEVQVPREGLEKALA